MSSITVQLDPSGDAPVISVDGGTVRVSHEGGGLHVIRYNIAPAETYAVLLSVDTIPVPVAASFTILPAGPHGCCQI